MSPKLSGSLSALFAAINFLLAGYFALAGNVPLICFNFIVGIICLQDALVRLLP